jgi:hypothetical protein
MMTTTNNTTTNTNIAQRKRAPEEEERLRDRWENRVVGALFRKLKREVRAANALFGAQEWVCPDLVAMWFMLGEEADVTRHAALAEECLDYARAHAKRKGREPPPLEYCNTHFWLWFKRLIMVILHIAEFHLSSRYDDLCDMVLL